MKKKICFSIAAVATALVVALSYTTTAFATSPTSTTEVTGTGTTAAEATDAPTDEPAPAPAPQVLGARRGGSDNSQVTISQLTDKTVLATLSDKSIFAKLVSDYSKQDIKDSEITVLDSFEVKPIAGVNVSKQNPLFVAFSFPGLTANSQAWVCHYGKKGWEVVPSTVTEGAVTGEFSEFSPVAIVAKTSTLNRSVLGANRAVSARTGDNRALVLFGGVAVVCLLGVIAKKKMFS